MVIQRCLSVWDGVKRAISYSLLFLAFAYFLVMGLIFSPLIAVWFVVRMYLVPMSFLPTEAQSMPWMGHEALLLPQFQSISLAE